MDTFSVKNLTKSYASNTIFSHANFTAKRGQIILLTGENGSGKSTFLKICARLEPFQAGQLTPSHSPVAILTEHDWLYPSLTILENLQFWSTLNQHPLNHALIAHFNLTSHQNLPLHQASQGLRKKTALIRALQSPAQLLLLDEPYTHLDQHSIQNLNQHLLHIHPQKIIIIASHDRSAPAHILSHTYHIHAHQILPIASSSPTSKEQK